MPFDETVYVTIEGGIVNPISHVTSNYSPSNVVQYDGETYRDDPTGLLGVDTTPDAGVKTTLRDTYAGSAAVVSAGLSDLISHTAPRYKGKQRTIWSFARTVSASAAFTHVVWGDLVLFTGSHAPYRLGQTPTTIS